MAFHNKLGSSGEKRAAEFLKEKGYEILCTNWRHERAEADIIATKDGVLIIAEVKTRSSLLYGAPDEAVGKQKQLMMIKAAEAYIRQMNIEMEVRYDVLSVIMKDEKELIHHIEEAFYPFSSQYGE